MGFTKGEWEAIKFEQPPYHWRIQTEQNILAAVYSEANAHLIASAPLLYEALKAIMEEPDFGLPGHLFMKAFNARNNAEGK